MSYRVLSGVLLAFSLVMGEEILADTGISLSITPAIQQAPGSIQLRIHIPQHRDNFWYCYGVYSPEETAISRRSCQQLNGIYSPSLFVFQYISIPAGSYQGFVELYRVPNRLVEKVQHNFVVIDNDRHS